MYTTNLKDKKKENHMFIITWLLRFHSPETTSMYDQDPFSSEPLHLSTGNIYVQLDQ